MRQAWLGRKDSASEHNADSLGRGGAADCFIVGFSTDCSALTGAVLPFALPDIGEEEAQAVKDVVLSGWLTTGDKCRQFEQEFAHRVGAPYAVAVNSGTAALHLALEALGIGPGDLVITSPYTFAATGEVIRYLGAIPIFVDVDPRTCNLDPGELEFTLSRLDAGDRSVLPPSMRGSTTFGTVKALLPVHIGGTPCELDAVYRLAAARDLAVVEDAAHALPSSYKGRMIGTPYVPRVSGGVCFSFYATKTLTTGEGGMLVSEDESMVMRARQMSLHGLSGTAWSRYIAGGTWKYDIEAPGFKYNLTDIAAAMGLVQLRRLDEMATRRTMIAKAYNEAFRDVPAIEVPVVPAGSVSSWHLYMLRLRLGCLAIDRDTFVQELLTRGVATSVHFIPLHLHSYYRKVFGYQPGDFPAALSQSRREISLPIYSRMTDTDVNRVASAVVEIAKQFER